MKTEIQEKDKKLSREIIRFAITGVICAALDFLTSYLVMGLVQGLSNQFLVVMIYTIAGFLVGVTANYFLSTFFVFRNVENKKSSKTPLFIVIFVLLSIVGWAISYATMLGCTELFKATTNLDISSFSLTQIFDFATWITPTFWLFVLSFGLKTLLGMIWNYLSRKFFLYKAPKEKREDE